MVNNQGRFNPSVTKLFELQAATTPDLLAIQDENSCYSYRDVNEKANQFAHWLLSKNLQKNDFVAILLEPNVDFIILMLAIIKIGAIYVPLDTKSPAIRIENVISDLSPQLLISSEPYQNQFRSTKNTVFLKTIQLESIRFSKDNPQTIIDGSAAIYLMYTSGSTGKPKGILIPHHAVHLVASF